MLCYIRNKIILKLFQSFISHVTTSETDIISAVEITWKLFWAAISFWNNFEIISGKFSRAEIKLFKLDVDEGCNNLISHVTTA